MAERGVDVDHSTIARWVVHYAPLLNQLDSARNAQSDDVNEASEDVNKSRRHLSFEVKPKSLLVSRRRRSFSTSLAQRVWARWIGDERLLYTGCHRKAFGLSSIERECEST